MTTYRLTLCPNPDCPNTTRGRPLPDVAGWCPACGGYEVVKVRVDVPAALVEAGERRGARPVRTPKR